jgi:hypothetical protein
MHWLCGLILAGSTFDFEARLAIILPVLLCTRFPTTPKGSAGANGRCRNLYNLKMLSGLLFAVLLFAFAAWQEGVMPMVSAAAIKLCVHLVLAVGSRVQSRT